MAGWHAIEGTGFRLVGNAPPDTLQKLARELALFEGAFAHLARRPANAVSARVPIYLFRDRDLAARFELGGMVAGWTLPTLAGCFAAVRVRPNHVETRATLFHEYTHALLRRGRRAPVPPWYDEGLSTYFSTLGFRDGAIVVGAAPAGGIAWIAKRGPFPLARLFSVSVWELRPEQIADFYATSWALSHQLLSTPGGRRELSAFAAQLERGAAWREAFAAAFARPPERLEAALETHVEALSRGVPAEATIDPKEVLVREPGHPIPLSSGEIAYELGYLALQLDEEGEDSSLGALARGLLGHAREADPSAPRPEAALAEARARDGDAAGAVPLAQQAQERAPDDARISLHVGRTELARAEEAGDGPDAEAALRSAEEAYRRALALDPGSAVAWEGLGNTWHRAGRTGEAEDALERARALGWSARLDLELGSLYLERGRREDALRLLWPLAQDPHRGKTAEEAMELLERAGLTPAE
jgi:Flp pilus assembly protein TadD